MAPQKGPDTNLKTSCKKIHKDPALSGKEWVRNNNKGLSLKKRTSETTWGLPGGKSQGIAGNGGEISRDDFFIVSVRVPRRRYTPQGGAPFVASVKDGVVGAGSRL